MADDDYGLSDTFSAGQRQPATPLSPLMDVPEAPPSQLFHTYAVPPPAAPAAPDTGAVPSQSGGGGGGGDLSGGLNKDLLAAIRDYKKIQNEPADPRIAKYQEAGEEYLQKGIAMEDKGAGEMESAAQDLLASDRQIQSAENARPNARAISQQAMASAPVLAMLTALGGKIAGVNGGAMLAATTGIMQGLNKGSNEAFDAAYQKWKDSYEALEKHRDTVMKYHEMMMQAYAGRADADQKASQAAIRMAGDLAAPQAQKLQMQGDYIKLLDGAVNTQVKMKEALQKEADRQNMGLPPGWTQSATDRYARLEITGDHTWKTGLARSPYGRAIIATVEERVPVLADVYGITPEEQGSIGAMKTALSKSLTKREEAVTAAEQYVSNFDKQAQIVEKYLAPGVGGQTPILNRWLQAGRKEIAGDKEVNELDAAIRGFAREHQRIVTGATASNAQLHVAAAETADQLLNKDMNADTIRGTMGVMLEEGRNAVQSGHEEINLIATQISSLGVAGKETERKAAETGGAPPPAPTRPAPTQMPLAPPAGVTLPPGARWSWTPSERKWYIKEPGKAPYLSPVQQ